jgi:hypothetical protein
MVSDRLGINGLVMDVDSQTRVKLKMHCAGAGKQFEASTKQAVGGFPNDRHSPVSRNLAFRRFVAVALLAACAALNPSWSRRSF